MKNRISLELSFVNSNLQLLKEKLSELNASVEIYQNDSHEVIMPFIPVGLKETIDINFMDTFSNRVCSSYFVLTLKLSMCGLTIICLFTHSEIVQMKTCLIQLKCLLSILDVRVDKRSL